MRGGVPGGVDSGSQAKTAPERHHRSYGKRWLDLFPQHGPGAKHERPIILAPWQRAIVDEHPELFLRGLIQSDGCRCLNRFTTTLPSGRVAEYEYPRYFFSNLSTDIRKLFCDYCERLGIRWTRVEPPQHLGRAPRQRRASSTRSSGQRRDARG